MRYRLLLSMLGLLAITSAPLAQPRPAATLDGTWRAVAAERDGKSATDVIGHRLTFAGNRYTITRDGQTVYAGTYKTDAAKRPAQIDFANTDAGPRGNWMGIYDLDGVALKICDNAPDTAKARPTAFAAPASSGHIFVAFTREKP